MGSNEAPSNISYSINDEKDDIAAVMREANVKNARQMENDNVLRNGVDAQNIYAGGQNNPHNDIPNYLNTPFSMPGYNPPTPKRYESFDYYNDKFYSRRKNEHDTFFDTDSRRKMSSNVRYEIEKEHHFSQSRDRPDPDTFDTDTRRKKTPSRVEPDMSKRTRSGKNYHGTGLQRIRKIIYGKGAGSYGEHKTSRIHRYYLDKYYVDMKKLNNNVLCVKYSLNDAFVPHLKVQKVSTGVKDVIEDILENKYNSKVFAMLNEMDKRAVKRFINACKLEIEVEPNLDKHFQETFEILLGEYQSGNDSPQVKKELKKYILEALQENKIPKSQAMLLLYEISL